MNTPQTPQTPASGSTDIVAHEFIDEQLRRARASLARTRTFCVASVLLVTGYMSFITWTLQTRLLQPKAAADLATSYVSTFVEQQGDAFADQLIQQVPGYIAGLPDVFLAQLPTVREDLEKQLEFVLSATARDVSQQLGEYLDDYLVNNREQIADLLNATQDPQLVEQLGEQFEQQALSYLEIQGADGRSVFDKLRQIATGLETVEAKLHRLAYAQDLTVEEQTLRQLIGVTMRLAKSKA